MSERALTDIHMGGYEESIMLTIKKMLGLDAEYTSYDADILVLINSACMTLNQIGVGPEKGFRIMGPDETWDELITNEKVMLNGVQEYIYCRVRMVFDPPQNSFVMEALKSQIKELEWRLQAQAESVMDFPFIPDDKHHHHHHDHTETYDGEFE